MTFRYALLALFAAFLAVSGGIAVADSKKPKEQTKQSAKAPASKDGYMKAAPSK